MIKAEFRWLRKKQTIYLGKFYAPYFCKVSSYTFKPNITKHTYLQLSENMLLSFDGDFMTKLIKWPSI